MIHPLITAINRFKPLRRAKQRALSVTNVTIRVRHAQSRFRVPILAGLGGANRLALAQERWMLSIIEAALADQPGFFVDVGVNVGQTLLKVKAVNPAQAYVGFEPNVACAAYVRKLIKANRFADCRIVPVGLSSQPTIVQLFTTGAGASNASMIEGFRSGSFYSDREVAVVFAGDAALDALAVNDVAIIKIDVEGAEADVIQGLTRTLADKRPAVVCEILPTGVDAADNNAQPQGALRRRRQAELLGTMKQSGYVFGRIAKEGRIARLDTIEAHQDQALCQYLFVPQERQGLLDRLQGP